MKFRDVEHLFRLAAIFAGGVLVFAVARAELVPDDLLVMGYMTYKVEFAAREGLLPAILVMVLPFVILAALIYLLPPGAGASEDAHTEGAAHATQRV